MEDIKIIQQHLNDKTVSVEFKERRFKQWNENYDLYRDRVQTNRLTQRQAVNVPIIRETLQSWISKIAERPEIVFETRDKGNFSKDKEIIFNEIYRYDAERFSLDLLDLMMKKIVGLQGRCFLKLGWSKNSITIDIIDPYDIEIDKNANPLNLETATYIIHTHIFKPLREILANDKYLESGKEWLKTYLDTTKGLIKAQEVRSELTAREDRLRNLGATNFDEYGATDFMVEINEVYRKMWDEKSNSFKWFLIIIAGDNAVLYKELLQDAKGIDYVPIISWADDPDLNDLWCDGKADSVRTINKIINSYLSQDLENRTYRNFGMFFYNTQNGNFQPRGYEPKPFGMFGVNGNPSEVMKQVEINPLNDTAAQITFLKDLIQSSVAQTPTERGVEGNQSTLGEIKINLEQSSKINYVSSKQYKDFWKKFGKIYYDLYKANSSGQITLYKQRANGEYMSKNVTDMDWKSPKGYECKVTIKSEKETNDNLSLQKTQFVQSSFAGNPIAIKIAKKKQLEILGWSSEEVEQVMQYEDQLLNQIQQTPIEKETTEIPQEK